MSDEPKKAPFERVGDYDVVAPIAEGGMASVWLGRARGKRAEFVALKLIRPEHARNKDFVAMFLDEAAIASRLVHPNIVGVRTFGAAHEDGVQPFLVMDLLRGRTMLESFRALHAHGRVFPSEAVAWLGARVADALAYAHELTDGAGAPLQIVHRDVNPANVFLTDDGVPKLIDFGLARARDRIASTAIGVVKGKLAYLAPEQARGQQADPRADVFALGVTLWELSLDRRLFLDESDVQTVRRVLEAEVPDPRTIEKDYPPELAEILLRALAKDRERRWPSAAALRDVLDAFAKSRDPEIGAPRVRAILAETFVASPKAPWERVVDEATAENEATRVWSGESADDPQPATGLHTEPLATVPAAVRPRRAPENLARLARSPSVTAGAVAIAGALLGALLVRGCEGHKTRSDMDRRVTRLEELLGVRDDGGAPTPSGPAPANPTATISADDPAPSCAEAKVTAYRAWQEAVVKAKANAQPAEAACANLWSESRKQACYGAAIAPIRAAQGARDSIIEGGPAAREALRAIKDDPKNEAIARARAASVATFDLCPEDAGAAGASVAP